MNSSAPDTYPFTTSTATSARAGLPLPSTVESSTHTSRPGAVRRFWWRTSRRTRLATACLGAVAALATTGAVGFSGGEFPQQRGSGGLDEAASRGDSLEVTVHTVSDVDLFEGAEPATGLSFRARIAGLRRMTDCWVAESRATAQDLLRGRNVRLVVRNDDDISGNDRIAVDVQLPDGTDYARTIVRDGVARADPSARGELVPVEDMAREERRGLWAAGCVPSEVVVTTSSTPSSSSASPSTTTTAPTTSTTESSTRPKPSRPPTTSSSPPPDDEWDDDRLGKFCLIEGSRRTTEDGNEMVCARNGKNQLRWRRAD